MPDSVVVWVCETPVASFVIVTVAPATDACFASTMRPLIRDVLVCADAVNGQTAIKTTANSCKSVRRIGEPSFVFNGTGKSRERNRLQSSPGRSGPGSPQTPEHHLNNDCGSISRRELASRFLSRFIVSIQRGQAPLPD